jgi:hypothetical protein
MGLSSCLVPPREACTRGHLAMTDEPAYHYTSRPYAKRFRYKYRRHVFDKLRAIDLVLAEFQQLLGGGEIIAEAQDTPEQLREIVLLVQWTRPLHVVIVVDCARQERDW